MHKFVVTLFLSFYSFAAAAEGQISRAPCDTLRVSVLPTNEVRINGRLSSLETLSKAIASTKKNNGSVIYFVEGDSRPPIANEVLQMVIAQQTPILMSQEADFSDVIDSYGYVKQR